MKTFSLLASLFLAAYSFSSAVAGDYNIVGFGAVADGKTKNTGAIQKAIDTCHTRGGGRVVVPAGKFLTGSLRLKSHVELFLDRDAVLLGSTQRNDYADHPRRSPAGGEVAGRPDWLSLIFAQGETNLAITGPGIIDGQGKDLAENTWQLLYGADPARAGDRGHRADEKYRPQLICFAGCRNVSIQGVTLKRSACWVQTYEKCDGLRIKGVRVDSTAFWNNDGIDIVDSKNVRIEDCVINAADDGICLKSHDPKGSCENISIVNCTVRSSASGLKLGTASVGGFRNIRVKGLDVYDTFRSAIALEGVDGGFLEDIQIDGVTARNVGNAFFIRRGERHGPAGPVRNISIKNMVAWIPDTKPDRGYETEGPGIREPHNLMPSSIAGLPGHAVENVLLENIDLLFAGGGNKQRGWVEIEKVPENPKSYPEFSMFGELPAWGLYIRHAKGVRLSNVRMRVIRKDERPAFVFDDVKALERERTTTGEITKSP